jgi:Protein of unknown function (DUF3558)
MRLLCLLALAGAALAVAACGGGSAPAPAPGSPERPLVAEQTRLGGSAAAGSGRSNEAASGPARTAPDYEALLKGQSRRPRRRFTPCNLVTAARARAILGAPIAEPVEAVQGPTCIYRTRNGRSFVTVSVQAIDFRRLKPKLRQRRRVAVAGRTAYCGTYGRPTLSLPLAHGRVLAIGAQCAVARQFARRAVRQLSG